MDFCRANGVALLIARCLVSELRAAQAMEREGFFLMDTLVYYACNLERTPIPSDTAQATWRPIRPGEEEAVRAVADQLFRGYAGHYHADERLDRTKCDEAYTSWALRSCVSRDVADDVLVGVVDGSIAGFATLRINSPEEGEVMLGGIGPAAQGRGIYRSLMIAGMGWCRSRGATRMVISTQITNWAVQKVWTRLGLEPCHAYYTFHKWFDGS
jgi:ribosomal protein S18 acetylase RimI-like enzyme